MITKRFNVIQEIEVTIDETKIDDDFITEYVEYFSPYYELEDHMKHLAFLFAEGIVDNDEFIEGYGETKDMGIHFKRTYTEIEEL